MEEDRVPFVFVGPEQFNNEETLDHLRAACPVRFVVDEAHCISEWDTIFARTTCDWVPWPMRWDA
ncbi:MAG: hypothetical protein NVS4B2_15680 [Chloroflexota bacterium]